jgi:pantoate--beta-alanine ligase
MRTVSRIKTVQQLAARWRRAGRRIGFVPTMGYLHAGHLSLIQCARKQVGPRGRVVVSIFVNPTQFGPQEDLERYPRDLARDTRLCRGGGVDLLFVPATNEMYGGEPGRPYSTYVIEERLSGLMEGISRPTHFRGVATVVAKLFNIVEPDAAIFGQKDFQQAALIQRMVRDLNFPVRIVVAPTVRERDGLAMSSRNKYLSAEERRQATALFEALQEARRRVRESPGTIGARPLRAALRKRIEKNPAARVDYISFFDRYTLEPIDQVGRGAHLALAVHVGKTRLIDNARL